MDTWHASGGSTFVCGSPFTEVSTVAWALAAHPAFWTSSESRFLYRLFGSQAGLERPYLYDIYMTCIEDGAWLHANSVSYTEFLAALGEGIGRLFQGRAGRRRWVDNSPENALLLDELVHIFPDARFVGLLQPLRSALYVAASGGSVLLPERVREVAQLNELYTDRLNRAAAQLPERICLIDEAELFGNPAAAFDDLLEFLGEDRDQAVVDTFARRLLRFGMPLAEARDALARFEPPSGTASPVAAEMTG